MPERKICPTAVNYESVIFYSTGPEGRSHKTFLEYIYSVFFVGLTITLFKKSSIALV